MTVIDIHAHYLPSSSLDALKAGARQFPSVTLHEEAESLRLSFTGGPPTRPIMAKLRGTEDRLTFMDGAGLDIQIVGGWLDAFGYELPPDEGADWSRFLNETLLKAVAPSARLFALATVPLQSGTEAANILREAVQSGAKGAMIGTQADGHGGALDDPQLNPFWAEAAALSVPIMIHPMFGSDDSRLHDFGMMNAVGRVCDVSIAVSRLLFTGHPLRFPGLKIVVATGGGALPYMLGRLERNYVVQKGGVSDPRAGYEKLYFDSIVFRPDALKFLMASIGVERIMLGSDFPFPIGDMTPLAVFDAANCSAEEKQKMTEGNARALFGL